MAEQEKLPVIGGKQVRWLCRYCFAMSFSEQRPSSWGRVMLTIPAGNLQFADICPTCIEKMEAAGGYTDIPLGCYADGPDPRS